MSIIFNQGQMTVIEAAVHWYYHSSELVFQYCGLAGTGKSLVLSEIIRRLNIPSERIAVMAYTGAATNVLRLKGMKNAKTIHSWLYTPVEDFKYDVEGKLVIDEYFNRPKFEVKFEPKPLVDIDLIIIDEASMVPKRMKSEIESRGIKIIATGDLGQLPPVADEPAYLYEGKIYELTEIMRQAEDSGIVYLSLLARKGQSIPLGTFNEVSVIREDDLKDDMVMMSDVVLCGKNNTREFINNKVRYELLNIQSELPTIGETMVCRKNNWDLEVKGINLTNGLRGVVTNQPGVETFDGECYEISFRPNNMDSLFTDLKCDYKYLISPYDMRDRIKKDKYSRGEKMEFGYGLTTHLSQGSQYNNVIYLEEYLSKDIQNQLNYTGITRAVRSLVYVKKNKKYYFK